MLTKNQLIQQLTIMIETFSNLLDQTNIFDIVSYGEILYDVLESEEIDQIINEERGSLIDVFAFFYAGDLNKKEIDQVVSILSEIIKKVVDSLKFDVELGIFGKDGFLMVYFVYKNANFLDPQLQKEIETKINEIRDLYYNTIQSQNFKIQKIGNKASENQKIDELFYTSSNKIEIPIAKIDTTGLSTFFLNNQKKKYIIRLFQITNELKKELSNIKIASNSYIEFDLKQGSSTINYININLILKFKGRKYGKKQLKENLLNNKLYIINISEQNLEIIKQLLKNFILN